jgi:hypothetical protein
VCERERERGRKESRRETRKKERHIEDGGKRDRMREKRE